MRPRSYERNYFHVGFPLINNSYLFGERQSESLSTSSKEIDSFRLGIVGNFF